MAVGAAVVAAIVTWAIWPRTAAPRPVSAGHVEVSAAGVATVERALAPPSAALAGMVLDEGGAPIAGASACARWDGDPAAHHPPACARTAGDGRFAIAPLAAGAWLVSASAPGHLPAAWRGAASEHSAVRLGDGERRDDVVITLGAGAVEVRGVVLDIAGGPIAEAMVEVGAALTPGPPVITRTADDGSFVAWLAEGPAELDVHADGYVPSTARLSAPTTRVVMLLEPEAVLEGLVVEVETSRPVADARVSLHPLERGPWTPDVLTDAAGRFRAVGLLPGRYQPSAIARGMRGGLADSVLLEPGVSAPVRIEVTSAAVVTGRIQLDDGGVVRPCPAEECEVTLMVGDEQAREGATTAANGEVTILAVAPGTYKVDVWARGYLDAAPQTLVVGDADVSGLTWTLARGASITGTVRGPDGAPVAGARVGGWSDVRDEGGWAITDARGGFEISGLPDGIDLTLEASAPGFVDGRGKARATMAPAAAAAIELRLAPAAVLEIAVVDARGAPVPDVSLMVWRGESGSQRITNDLGRVVERSLAPGPMRVEVPDERIEPVVAEVHGGQVTTVRLVVAARVGVLAGQVVDERGEPIDDALVRAAREGDGDGAWATRGHGASASPPVMTDEDGRFRLTGLSAGPFTVRAFRRGGGEVLQHDVAAGATLRLVIAPTGTLAGIVSRPGGPPPAFTVEIQDPSTAYLRRQAYSSAGGEFALVGVPAGTYEVTVTAGDARVEQTVVLAAGQHRDDLRVALPRPLTLRGTLVALADGRPLAGVRVAAGIGLSALLRGAATGDGQGVSDGTGRFVIRGVNPTSQTAIVTSRGAGLGMVIVPVVAAPGGPAELDVGTIHVPGDGTGVEHPGELGFDLELPDAPPLTGPFVVDEIEPDGPAAAAGLKVGDELLSVSGADVTGARGYLVLSLLRVAPGTSVRLGLRGGRQVTIVAASPDEH
jgi:protocatechuate 3,4-dioxygenase beta subunit